MMSQSSKQLAAILFSDIIGYTAMMQQNEQHAMGVARHYLAVLQEEVASHAGKVMNDYGDGSLCTFGSVTDAVNSAIKIQQRLQEEPVVSLRIGLHIGEIFIEQGKVHGDGVNVASRIQSLGQANTILISKEIYDKIRNQPEYKCISLGYFRFKNVHDATEVYALANAGLSVPRKNTLQGKLEKQGIFKKKYIVTVAILMAAVVSFLVWKYAFGRTNSAEPNKSIAILPFKSTGAGEFNVSDGLVEDILAYLSKIRELKVISNASSSKYGDQKKPIKEIGEELNVGSVLTGNIQQSGNRIKVSVQLIDCKTEGTIWAEVYDNEIGQVFDLEMAVASKIVSALKSAFTAGEKRSLSKRYTDNLEAYKSFTRARSFFQISNYDSSLFYFQRAIEIDSEYALAYAGIAEIYMSARSPTLTRIEATNISRKYAEKSLSIDSTLSEGYTDLGFIEQAWDYDWEASQRTLEKAIELDPNNSYAHLYYGNQFVFQGQFAKGLTEVQKALDIDPLSLRINWALGRNYYFSGQYDLAISQLQKAIKLYPKGNVSYNTLTLTYLAQKKFSQAKQAADALPKAATWLLDNPQIIQAYVYAILGDRNNAVLILDSVLKQFPVQRENYALASVYVALGDIPQALNYLETAVDNREVATFFMKVDPRFAPIRNDPGFKAILAKMHL